MVAPVPLRDGRGRLPAERGGRVGSQPEGRDPGPPGRPVAAVAARWTGSGSSGSSPLGWPSPAVTVGQLRRRPPRAPGARVRGGRAGPGDAAACRSSSPSTRTRRACSAPAAPRPPSRPSPRRRSCSPGSGSTAWPCCPSTPTWRGCRPRRSRARCCAGLWARGTSWWASPSASATGEQGDARLLAALGEDLGFAVRALPPVLEEGAPVSSSRVRDALGRGDVRTARALLGRPYFVDGPVVRGDGRGRTIGVPTANLAPENEILPARGVYAARCRVERRRLAPGGRQPGPAAHLRRRAPPGRGAPPRLRGGPLRLSRAPRVPRAPARRAALRRRRGPRRPHPRGRRAGARPAFGARRRGV